jgi:hypothetical protein
MVAVHVRRSAKDRDGVVRNSTYQGGRGITETKGAEQSDASPRLGRGVVANGCGELGDLRHDTLRSNWWQGVTAPTAGSEMAWAPTLTESPASQRQNARPCRPRAAEPAGLRSGRVTKPLRGERLGVSGRAGPAHQVPQRCGHGHLQAGGQPASGSSRQPRRQGQGTIAAGSGTGSAPRWRVGSGYRRRRRPDRGGHGGQPGG